MMRIFAVVFLMMVFPAPAQAQNRIRNFDNRVTQGQQDRGEQLRQRNENYWQQQQKNNRFNRQNDQVLQQQEQLRRQNEQRFKNLNRKNTDRFRNERRHIQNNFDREAERFRRLND